MTEMERVTEVTEIENSDPENFFGHLRAVRADDGEHLTVKTALPTEAINKLRIMLAFKDTLDSMAPEVIEQVHTQHGNAGLVEAGLLTQEQADTITLLEGLAEAGSLSLAEAPQGVEAMTDPDEDETFNRFADEDEATKAESIARTLELLKPLPEAEEFDPELPF